MGLLFTLAIFIAAAALGYKRIARNRALRKATWSEDKEPRLVVSHAAVDDAVAEARCSCGGARVVEGEGPKGELWRVLTRCRSCGARRAFLFRVAS